VAEANVAMFILAEQEQARQLKICAQKLLKGMYGVDQNETMKNMLSSRMQHFNPSCCCGAVRTTNAAASRRAPSGVVRAAN